jgi:hypothetical protein
MMVQREGVFALSSSPTSLLSSAIPALKALLMATSQAQTLSQKRKRESGLPRITYYAPNKTFDRLFNGMC